jgi:hypothetical protein
VIRRMIGFGIHAAGCLYYFRGCQVRGPIDNKSEHNASKEKL